MSDILWKDIFAGFQYTVSKITSLKKLYCILMHYSARQVLRALFSTNQGNCSETTFVAGATKINLTTLKIWLWLDGLMQETIWRHQLFRDGRAEPLKDSARSLTWAYDLKALKSSS